MRTIEENEDYLEILILEHIELTSKATQIITKINDIERAITMVIETLVEQRKERKK